MAEQVLTQTTVFLDTSDRLFGSPCNSYYVTPFMTFPQLQNVPQRVILRLSLYLVHFEADPLAFQDVSLVRLHTSLGLDVHKGNRYTTLLAEFCPHEFYAARMPGGSASTVFVNYQPWRWPAQTTEDAVVPGMRVWLTDQDDRLLRDEGQGRHVVGDVHLKFFVELVKDRSEDQLRLLEGIRQQLRLSFELEKLRLLEDFRRGSGGVSAEQPRQAIEGQGTEEDVRDGGDLPQAYVSYEEEARGL